MSINNFVNFLYSNIFGRLILKIITSKTIIRFLTWLMNKPISKIRIKGFIKKNNINMNDYEEKEYTSFNDFFIRKKKELSFDIRPNTFVSPADGLISVYSINDNSVFKVKGTEYSLNELLNENINDEYRGGEAIVIRLRATDYHHYIYGCDGYQEDNHFIEGKLHSVQPIALHHFPVYRQNRREWTVLHTNRFGDVIEVEVGAVLVGGFVNKENISFNKGDERGYFELCGSTIVLFFKEGKIKLVDELNKVRDKEEEVEVKVGDVIGYQKSI